MDYMEAAAQLGQAIANSSEMKAWKDAEAALMEDEKGNTLMEEYRDAQMKMVRASREGLARKKLRNAEMLFRSKENSMSTS